MLEEFAASFLSLGTAPAIARLEDVPPAEVSYTCSLPGRYQAPPQHADLVLQTPPPRPTLRVVDSPPVPSQQEHTQAGAASEHDEDWPPGFGPAKPTVDDVPPGTPPADAHQTAATVVPLLQVYSRRNVTVVRGTREVLPLQLFPDASSPVKEVVANFVHDVCTEAPPPVLVASPPRRRS